MQETYIGLFKRLFSSEGMTENEARVWRSPIVRVLQIAIALALVPLAIGLEFFIFAFEIVALAVMSVIALALSPIAMILSYLQERDRKR